MPEDAPVTMMVRNSVAGGIRGLTQGLPFAAIPSHIRGVETIEGNAVLDAEYRRPAPRALRRAWPFQHRRRLGDGQPSGDHLADGAVSVPDLCHDAGELPRRAGVCRHGRASGLRHLARTDRQADRARGAQRADRQAHRPVDLRRAACRLFCLERHRGAAHLAQPRLPRRPRRAASSTAGCRASSSC